MGAEGPSGGGEAVPRSVPPASPPWGEGVEGAENLEIDERLLSSASWACRAAYLLAPVVSLGVAQARDDPVIDRARSLGIAVVRRRSGGSGLLHGRGDLVWSIVVPRGEPFAGRDFPSTYTRLGEGVVGWLYDLGVTAEWSAPLGLSDRFCLLGSRGYVLTVRGRAIGGAAQHVTRDALLHHGTVALRAQRDLLGRLFDLEAGLLERYVTSLEDEGVTDAGATLTLGLCRRLRDSLPAGALV